MQIIASCENCLKHWPRNPRTAGTVQTPTLQCICTGIGAQQLSDCFQPFAARISELTQREIWRKHRKPGLNMSRSCMMQEASLQSVPKNPHGISPLYPHYSLDYGGPTMAYWSQLTTVLYRSRWWRASLAGVTRSVEPNPQRCF